MRRVIVSEFMTLDGVIEDPGGGEGSPIGGWSFKFPDTSGDRERMKFEELMECDALLLGRVTYEAFAAAWPNIQDEAGFAAKMNSMPKYVATSTLTEFAWNNSTPIAGDVASGVRELKEQPGGPLLVGGSASLVQTLAREGLVDEYRLMVHPIVVGQGKRLFAGDDVGVTTLDLVDSTPLSSGLIALTYRPVAG